VRRGLPHTFSFMILKDHNLVLSRHKLETFTTPCIIYHTLNCANCKSIAYTRQKLVWLYNWNILQISYLLNGQQLQWEYMTLYNKVLLMTHSELLPPSSVAMMPFLHFFLNKLNSVFFISTVATEEMWQENVMYICTYIYLHVHMHMYVSTYIRTYMYYRIV